MDVEKCNCLQRKLCSVTNIRKSSPMFHVLCQLSFVSEHASTSMVWWTPGRTPKSCHPGLPVHNPSMTYITHVKSTRLVGKEDATSILVSGMWHLNSLQNLFLIEDFTRKNYCLILPLIVQSQNQLRDISDKGESRLSCLNDILESENIKLFMTPQCHWHHWFEIVVSMTLFCKNL